MANYAHFYPCGNGDCSVIRVGDQIVITDVNYRQTAQNDSKAEYFDFGSHLRQACSQDDGTLRATVFVLTHPDQDHLSGMGDLFHLGEPQFDPETEDGTPLILIEELWVTPYAVDPNDSDSEAKQAVYAEIRRRYALLGTESGEQPGNILRVLTTDDVGNDPIVLSDSLQATILAPTPEEADIPDSGDSDAPNSANDSSLVIQWAVSLGDDVWHVLLGGDATAEVWERIWNDDALDQSRFQWDILLAPHHCSRGALERRTGKDADGNSEYEDCPDAKEALGQAKPGAFVVVSANEFEDGKTPPNPVARNHYLDVLTNQAGVIAEDNLIQPEVHDDGDPAPVEFNFDDGGLSREPASSRAATVETVSAAGAAPGEFG